MSKIEKLNEEDQIRYSEEFLAREKYSGVILTDEEALEVARKTGVKNFSTEMSNDQKVRVKVSSLCCPVCQSKDLRINPIKIRRVEEGNDTHSMYCRSCEVSTTLWGVGLADHYVV